MPYLICFIISILVLMMTIAWDDHLSKNALILLLITAIGDGGYYSLSISSSLERAVLANIIIYIIGVFAPMFMFLNLCDICSINISSAIKFIMYTVQMAIYICVLTSGHSTLFYTHVALARGPIGYYLTKEYGIVHSLYIATMVIYLAACIFVAFLHGKDNSRVSFKNIDYMIIIFFLLGSSYMVERLIHLTVELMPFIYTLGVIGLMIPIIKLSRYSIDQIEDIQNYNLSSAGYIVFTKKLLYMGSNKFAKNLFPELEEWELEKKLSGKGGRFNSYIRPAFIKYVESKSEEPEKIKLFNIKDRYYSCEMLQFHHKRHSIGYIIKIVDVTDYQIQKN